MRALHRSMRHRNRRERRTYRATLEIEIETTSAWRAKDQIRRHLRDAGLQIVWWLKDPEERAQAEDPFAALDRPTAGPMQARGVTGSRDWR